MQTLERIKLQIYDVIKKIILLIRYHIAPTNGQKAEKFIKRVWKRISEGPKTGIAFMLSLMSGFIYKKLIPNIKSQESKSSAIALVSDIGAIIRTMKENNTRKSQASKVSGGRGRGKAKRRGMDGMTEYINSNNRKIFIDAILLGNRRKDRSARDVISEIIMVFARQMEHGAPLRDLLEKAALAIAKGHFLKAKILTQRGLSFAAKNANSIALIGAGALASFATVFKNKLENAVNSAADKVMGNEKVNEAIGATVEPIRFLKDAIGNFIGIVQIISAITRR